MQLQPAVTVRLRCRRSKVRTVEQLSNWTVQHLLQRLPAQLALSDHVHQSKPCQHRLSTAPITVNSTAICQIPRHKKLKGATVRGDC